MSGATRASNQALIRYGLLPPASATRLWASSASLRAIAQGRKLLLGTLSPGTKPLVMLMDFTAVGGGNDWLAAYDPDKGFILMYKPLVERWESLEAMRRTGTISRNDDGVPHPPVIRVPCARHL